MSRSTQVTDEQILAAAMECIAADGPSPTLADVGARVGLSAPRIYQRFGTKRELLLRVLELWSERVSTSFAGDGEPLDRIVAGLSRMTDLMATPRNVANVTASLYIYLEDPEFREAIQVGYRGQRAAITALLNEAIARDQLKPCDTEALSRLLVLTVRGAEHAWAVEPDGELDDWVQSYVRDCLAPWLTESGSTSAIRQAATR
jgi:AcrR family transcriptional regulator